jgi:outer membrane receptor protein involved in Fe transport
MWKLGLNWTVNDSLRFRGTVSADTRAPSVLDLFNTATVTQGRNTVPYSTSPVGIRSSGQNITTGNPDLKPEHARTYTTGIVLSPSFVPSFQASVDWYKIKIVDQIGGAGNLIDNCYFGDQEACKGILVNGQPVTTTTGITAADFVVVTSKPINTPSGVTTSGLDFATAYTHAAGPGKLGLRLNGVYLLKVENPNSGCATGTLGTTTEFVGSIGCGNAPRISGRLQANYDIGRFGVGVTQRYIDKGVINPNFVAGVDITFNDVPAIWYTDLNFNYDAGSWFGGKGSAFLNVTNAFNRDPPVTTQSSRSWIVPTDFGAYDVQGRRYTLGVRFKW